MASSDIKPYPFMFDPSQWANTYSGYAGKALPFMGLYSGGATGPTDAHGNPIQSYQDAAAAHAAWQPPAAAQGTTLNSAPQSGLGPGGQYGDWTQLAPASPGGPSSQAQYAYNLGLGGVGASGSLNPASPAGQDWLARQGQQQGQGQGQQAAAAAPTNPVDMNAAYLQALSNPGKVRTPGATVPQANLPSGQSGVLQQFLQNWQGGGGNTQGAGNYNNAGFFNALRGQV